MYRCRSILIKVASSATVSQVVISSISHWSQAGDVGAFFDRGYGDSFSIQILTLMLSHFIDSNVLHPPREERASAAEKRMIGVRIKC